MARLPNGKGWHLESHRHALASMGIKTGHFTNPYLFMQGSGVPQDILQYNSEFNSKLDTTKSRLKERLIQEAKEIWKSDLIDKVNIQVEVEPPGKMKVNASLNYAPSANPMVIGDDLVRVPSKVTLHIKPELLDQPDEKVVRTLRHEALHFGFPNHGRGFIEMAEKTHTSICNQDTEGCSDRFKVQTKGVGENRYTTMESFETYEQAIARAKLEANAEGLRKSQNQPRRFTGIRVAIGYD